MIAELESQLKPFRDYSQTLSRVADSLDTLEWPDDVSARLTERTRCLRAAAQELDAAASNLILAAGVALGESSRLQREHEAIAEALK